MARLCVRIAPNNHPADANLDALRTQPGDVVCIVDDDHVFSSAELNCGQYKIIDVPDVPQEDLAYLVTSVYDAEQKLVSRRAVKLELTEKTTVTKSEIDALAVAKV